MKIQSTPTLRRMPTYLHRLYTLRNNGAEWVTCADLAIYMNLSHIVVRKDMAMTNLAGNRRYGFRVDDLIEICKVLNLDISEVFTKDIFNMGCRKWY